MENDTEPETPPTWTELQHADPLGMCLDPKCERCQIWRDEDVRLNG